MGPAHRQGGLAEQLEESVLRLWEALARNALWGTCARRARSLRPRAPLEIFWRALAQALGSAAAPAPALRLPSREVWPLPS